MKTRTIVVAVALVAAAFTGCVREGEGSASLYVKDAPTDEFEEVHVVFADAYVHQANDSEEAGDENETDDRPGQGQTSASFARHGDRGGQGAQNQFNEQAGWIPVVDTEDPIDVNLLNATGTQAAFLAEANLTSGTYTQLAVVVDDAYGIDNNGSRVDITVPSGVGRIVQSFEVPNGEEAQIVIDLELDRALTESGQGWKLTPVFGKTTVNTVDDGASGSDEHRPGDVTEVE